MKKVTEKINGLERIRVNSKGDIVLGTFANESAGKLYEWNETFRCYESVGRRNPHQLYLAEA